MEPGSINRRRISVLLFGASLAVYALFAQGTIRSWDGGTMAAVAASIVERGHLSVPEGSLGKRGVDGKWYAQYSIGCSLVAVPVYVVGKSMGFAVPSERERMTEFAVSWINPIITALTGALLFNLAMSIGCGLSGSLLGWGMYCFGTTAFPLMKEFYSEPLTALLLLISVWYVINPRHLGLRRASLWAGVALAGVVLCRTSSVVAGPVILGVIASRGWRSGRLREAAVQASWAAIPVLVSLGLVAWYNWVRFGSALDSGYSADIFSAPLLTGLYIHLLSPQRSLFLYMPFLIFTPVGGVWLWRKRPDLVALVGGLFAVHLVLYSCFEAPEGGHTPGNRYLVVVLPLLVLLAGYAWQHLTATWRRVFVALVVIAVGVQLPLAYINVGRYYAAQHAALAQAPPDFRRGFVPLIIAAWPEAVRATSEALFHSDVVRRMPERVASKSPQELLGQRYFHTPYLWWVMAYFHGIPWGVMAAMLAAMLGANVLLWRALIREIRRARPLMASQDSITNGAS